MAETIRLVGDVQRQHAKRKIDEAPLGHVVKIGAETRRDEQNRKLWPMLKDLQRQVPHLGPWSTEDIKLMFLNQLGIEMRFLPTLESEGMFPVGLRSSTLTVAQFSALIELLYAHGAKHGVVWSEPENLPERRSA